MKRLCSPLKATVYVCCFLLPCSLSAQKAHTTTDTFPTRYLSNITVVGRNSVSDIHQLPEIVGTSIYAGKKSALIVMDNVQGNVVNNNMRQIMAKVPGIHIWESDGSGIQIGIAARGLSPNRSWEFNIRQNGYDISADPYGYPEAYYNPQLQAVQRIEIIRGQGSLQYGPQFGGMVNYILRNGSEINKPFQFETQQTVGSNGLYNSYNAIGGENKKVHYYAFFDHRNAAGWRQNGSYFTNNGFGTITYKITPKWALTAEVMHAHQRSQQPGGLTDADFNKDPQASTRSRNWFNIRWTTFSIINDIQFNQHTRLNIKLFGIAGNRSSIGYLRAINLPDSINPATMQYNNRALDIDQYRNFGLEARLATDYHFVGSNATLSTGVRLYHGQTSRFKDGVGDNGTNYSTVLTSAVWPKEIKYKSFNAAIFAENIFRLGKLLLVPGFRVEQVAGDASGINGYASNGNAIYLQNQNRSRYFLLAGLGAEYHLQQKVELYANITQAYRPMQFSDLTAPPTTDEIDNNLKDAKGYNADLGIRGRVKSYLYFDISAYHLQYNNRIGSITQQRVDGSFYNYRTNVGNSTSRGIEALAEFSFIKAFHPQSKHTDFTVFVSFNYNDAKYGSLKVITKSGNSLVESNLKNKRVENAPERILRSGFNLTIRDFGFTAQLSHVSACFSDANNTVTPTANGQIGLIPAYTVADIHSQYKINSKLTIKAGVNNLANHHYFTRRAGGYPGPGVLPADGRSGYFSIAATL